MVAAAPAVAAAEAPQEARCAFCGAPFRPHRPQQRYCPSSARDENGKPKNCRFRAWERDHPRKKAAPRRRPERRAKTDVTVRLKGAYAMAEWWQAVALRRGGRKISIGEAARELVCAGYDTLQK